MSAETKSANGKSQPTRNPVTEARFRRQAWWQITFPVLAVTVLLLGGVGGLFAMSGAPGFSIMADYSVILVSLPALIIGLVLLIAMVALTVLATLLIRRIPPYTYVAHQYFGSIHDAVVGFTDRVTRAVIGFLSILSGVSRFLKQYSDERTGQAEPGSGLD